MAPRSGTPRVRRGLAGVGLVLGLVLGLAACGDDAGGADGADGGAGAEPSPSEMELTGSPDGFVPGNPDNEVRPATAAEQDDWPACADVWTSSGEIPADYRGCVIGDDAVVADRIRCSFGGSMTTFDDRYYGVLGAVVNDAGESLATDRDYAKAYGQCTG